MDLRKSRTLRTDCLAGAKLFPFWLVSSDVRRSFMLRRNCPSGAKILSPAIRVNEILKVGQI